MKRIYHCTECGGYGSHHPLCPNYVDPPEERNADDMRDEDNDRADQRAREDDQAQALNYGEKQ